MASKTRTETMPLGPGTLTLDGVNAGYVEDLKLMVEVQATEATVGDYGGDGGTPIEVFTKATKARVEVKLDQVNLTILQKSILGALRTVSGSAEKLSFGATAGERQTSQVLLFTPLVAALATAKALQCYRVVPVDSREIAYNNDQQKTAVVFECLIDEGRSNGDRLLSIGDQSVAIDATAPVLSSSTPGDDTTGGSAATATLTFSKAMDESTINAKNIIVVPAGETSTQTFISTTYSLNAAGTIVTLTYTLGATTQYNIILGQGLKDAAGNAYAGSKISFTTT